MARDLGVAVRDLLYHGARPACEPIADGSPVPSSTGRKRVIVIGAAGLARSIEALYEAAS